MARPKKANPKYAKSDEFDFTFPPARRPFTFKDGNCIKIRWKKQDGEEKTNFIGVISCMNDALFTVTHQRGYRESFRKLDYEAGVIDVEVLE